MSPQQPLDIFWAQYERELAARGWTAEEVVRRLGLSQEEFTKQRADRTTQLGMNLAATIQQLFGERNDIDIPLHRKSRKRKSKDDAAKASEASLGKIAPRERMTNMASQTAIHAEVKIDSTAWTGAAGAREFATRVRCLVPTVMDEINAVIAAVEERRFNDPETRDALRIMRELHAELGALIDAIERGDERIGMAALIAKNASFVHFVGLGAKVGVVAPSFSLGVSHIMSYLSGIPVDSTMISTIFGGLIASEAASKMSPRRK